MQVKPKKALNQRVLSSAMCSLWQCHLRLLYETTMITGKVEVVEAFSQMLQVSWLDSRHEGSTSFDTAVRNCTNTGHIIPVYIIISSSVLPETRLVKFRSISLNFILCTAALCKQEAKKEKTKVFHFLFIQTYVGTFHFPTKLLFSRRPLVFFTSCRSKTLNPRLRPD